MNDTEIEAAEIIRNAKAQWRLGNISDRDLMDICRRAGLDAALSTTAEEIDAQRTPEQANELRKELTNV